MGVPILQTRGGKEAQYVSELSWQDTVHAVAGCFRARRAVQSRGACGAHGAPSSPASPGHRQRACRQPRHWLQLGGFPTWAKTRNRAVQESHHSTEQEAGELAGW